jgi:hypothetical protein
MRKSIITFSAIFAVFALFAQDETPKQDKAYFPEAGEIAVGLDGGPVLNYLGNMFNGTQNNALNLNDNRLYFRYFLSDNSAVRAVIGITNNTVVDRFYVRDDADFFTNPLSQKQLEDVITMKNRDMMLRVGYQQFRGYKRLLGFYGADFGYRYQKNKTMFEYGNEMTTLNPTPTTNWGNLSPRTLEQNNGAINTIFLGAFTGAEYYFLPKMCIGAEFGLSYGAAFEKQTHRKRELMVGSLHVEEEVAIDPGSRWSATRTEFPYTYGSLYFMIHF